LSWPPPSERRAASDAIYEKDPDRFLGEPTRFFHWSLPYLTRLGSHLSVLELGCGPGRDARALASAGHVVWAVDHSSIALERARAQPCTGSLRFEQSDALSALRGRAPSSVDAVYAHALYMMLSEEELRELLRELSRALRPGGLHLFALRSVTDPRATTGREIAPDVRYGGPHTTPHRFYRAESVASFGGRSFERVATEFEPDLHLWYVCDRRPGPREAPTEGLL
jgi:SAM-dependent methyltransferase